MTRFFDLEDKELRNAYVEEAFIADVQYDICRLMKAKGASRAELARRLNVSAPHVTQLLGNEGSNLTLRTVARIYHALGEEPFVCAKRDQQEKKRELGASLAKANWCSVPLANDSWTVEENSATEERRETTGAGVVVWLPALRKAA